MIENGNFSNITLDNIMGISGITAGGFAGEIDKYGTLSNIVLSHIGDINGVVFTGGFAGEIANGTFSNIVLNHIGNISAINLPFSYAGIYAGGFIGNAHNGTFSNIVLNHIGNISADSTGQTASDSYAGGFAGEFAKYIFNGTLSNIVLNHIGNISADTESTKEYSYTGGFVGEHPQYFTITDIYFYGSMNLSGNTQNTNHITSQNPTILNLNNSSDLTTLQNYMQPDSTLKKLEYITDTSGNSYLHMVTNGKIGDKNSNIIFNKDNSTYKLSEVSTGNTSPVLPSIPNEGVLSNVTLDKNDFDVSFLEPIINEILNENYLLNLDLVDFEKFNKDYATILSYLLEKTTNETLKESIKQTLDFYAEFNKGGLKKEFDKWYDSSSTYSISMNKYKGIINSLNTLKEYAKVTLKPELESIQYNLERFEFLKAEIARLDKIYQEALENKLLPYDQLEIIYEETKKRIDAYYAEAKDLLVTLEIENKPFLEQLIGKEFYFKDKYSDNTLTGKFSIAGDNISNGIKDNINSGLGDKPNLKLPENGDSNDQTIENGNTDIANDIAKQIDLASKEPVLILPAEEEKVDIQENSKERVRLCIVSDNAKTTTVCTATIMN
ncbi:hypothetical protein IO476_001597 [Campylobacter coli]|nr:hypothetical protein [Campylobacter coli]